MFSCDGTLIDTATQKAPENKEVAGKETLCANEVYPSLSISRLVATIKEQNQYRCGQRFSCA